MFVVVSRHSARLPNHPSTAIAAYSNGNGGIGARSGGNSSSATPASDGGANKTAATNINNNHNTKQQDATAAISGGSSGSGTDENDASRDHNYGPVAPVRAVVAGKSAVQQS